MAKRWSDDDELVVFDELHKFRRWKNWLCGQLKAALRASWAARRAALKSGEDL